MTSNVDTLRHTVMSPNTGSSLHRENGKKKSMSGKIVGSLKFSQNTGNLHQNTGNLGAYVLNSLILKIKDVAISTAIFFSN